jgi:hypothetical protein
MDEQTEGKKTGYIICLLPNAMLPELLLSRGKMIVVAFRLEIMLRLLLYRLSIPVPASTYLPEKNYSACIRSDTIGNQSHNLNIVQSFHI